MADYHGNTFMFGERLVDVDLFSCCVMNARNFEQSQFFVFFVGAFVVEWIDWTMRYTRMVVTGRRTFKAGGKSYSMILHFLTLTAGFDVSIRQPSFTGSSQVTVSQLWEINDHASPTPTNALIFFVTIFSIFKALVKNTLLICFPLIGWSVIGISGSNLMVFVVRTIRQSNLR